MDYYSQIYMGSSRSGSVSILSRACERPVSTGRAIRFEVPTRYFEELAHRKLKEGRLYLIKGRVESQAAGEQVSWKFRIYRFVTLHFKLRIYLPERYHNQVIPGQTYRVIIEAFIERRPRHPTEVSRLLRHGGKWSELSNRLPGFVEARVSNLSSIQPWRWSSHAEWIDWKVVAAWMDTEGYLYVKEGRRRRYELVIRQSEPEPLEKIQGFLKAQGVVRCSVKWVTDSEYTTGGIYELKLKALKELDDVVARTRPYLMVPLRKGQYRRYVERRKESPNLVKFAYTNVRVWNTSKWVDWHVVAAWIDGEGNLTTRERGPNHSHRDYCLDISQKDRRPLESIRTFLKREGIKARVVKKKNGTYSLKVTSVSGIDLIIRRTLPFLMTDNKRLQYEEYMTRRRRIPKRGPRPKPPLF